MYTYIRIHLFVGFYVKVHCFQRPCANLIHGGSAQVFPSIDVLKTKVIKLDKEIVLPVLRNSGKLAEGDELCLHTEKKDKAQQGEPLRAAPSKRLRTG